MVDFGRLKAFQPVQSVHIILLTIIANHHFYILEAQSPRGLSEALDKAIEKTKMHQSADRDQTPEFKNLPSIRSNRPVKVEELDTERLNLLIKTIDKGWVMPKLGFQEPVGSNFQYKKTCASIYKARYNACEQPGFGIMCFNFCFEQGEKLKFKCVDMSDLNYCKSNSNYDAFLSKYKKDTYRAKAYIHQMISRCYLSAICNGGALLNSTLVMGQNRIGGVPMHLRALANLRSRKLENVSEEADTDKDKMPSKSSGKRRVSAWERHLPNRSYRPKPKDPYREEEIEGERHVTPKYVPFWRRLLGQKSTTTRRPSTKMTTTPPSNSLSIEADEYEDYDEDSEIEDRNIGDNDIDADFDWAPKVDKQKVQSKVKRRREPQKNRYTWIPLKKIAGRPETKSEGYRLQFGSQKRTLATAAASEEPVGFWNKFQPGRWFQSIHFLTNTG